ncbi:MAG: anti-sigma F factor [Clostridia bacterium]|nr:anti-sigma F factor [Clostridia bacterium]
MKVINQFKMQLPAKSMNESFSRVAVGAFIAQLDPLLEEISDIKTAVSEAVTNCIVHAYREQTGDIFISVKILSDNRVVIKIRDKGCGIANIEKAMEPLFTTGGSERAGLGFAVMQSFVDKVRVISTVGKGTTVTLYKKINSR